MLRCRPDQMGQTGERGAVEGQMRAFPIHQDSPVEHRGDLPPETDVVVIGGGVIGVMTAWELATKGLRVALLEKGRIAGEQSSRNWGWIRAQGRDPAELPIVLEAQRMWQQIAATIGEDIGLRQGGVAYLARHAADLAGFEAWLPHARAVGLDTRLLTRAETEALIPAKSWHGALWTASDMKAEPWVAVPAMARAAVRAGVVIREACAVRGLDIAAGRIAGVISERGRIACSRVVLAGGAWSSLLLRRHGVSIPQLSVRATVAATAPVAEVFGGAATDDRLAFRRRSDGGYTLAPAAFHEFMIGPDAFRALGKYIPQLRKDASSTRFLPAAPAGYPDGWTTPRSWADDRPGPFEAMRILNPRPHAGKVQELRQLFEQTFPQAGPIRIEAAWAGMIDTMPDVVPIVDHVPALPGLTLATGMAGHGFGIGPGIGRVVARLVAGEAPGFDLRRFRFNRFSDGSPIDLGPHL